jgi:hypothetical protein
MKESWMGATSIAVALVVGCATVNQAAIAQSAKREIVHDSEYYILATQHGDQWAAERYIQSARLCIHLHRQHIGCDCEGPIQARLGR